MKLTRTWPSDERIAAFLKACGAGDFSYREVGATRTGPTVPGYANDHHRAQLGKGEADFLRACAVLRQWRMFPGDWVDIAPRTTPIAAGQTVAMIARAFGVHWVSAARIVYVLDEPRRFGFAYGTLGAHVECGEERFLVEWLADDTVWYDLRAFSRPRRWFIRLGYPLARRLQRRFAHDSQAAFRRALALPGTPPARS